MSTAAKPLVSDLSSSTAGSQNWSRNRLEQRAGGIRTRQSLVSRLTIPFTMLQDADSRPESSTGQEHF